MAAAMFPQILLSPLKPYKLICRVQDSHLMDDRLPKVKSLWNVDDQLGGWSSAQKKFFASKVRYQPWQSVCAILL